MLFRSRPYYNGAFTIAAKYGIPVVPQFITFRDSGKKDEEGIGIPYFTVNVGEPVYPDNNLSRAENVDMFRDKVFDFSKNVYEQWYGKSLIYKNAEKEVSDRDSGVWGYEQ